MMEKWERTGRLFSEYENHESQMQMPLPLSYRNFLEMSSKTADDKFLLQKKIERVFLIDILINGFRCTAELHLAIDLTLRHLLLVIFKRIMQNVLLIDNIEENGIVKR
jgi:kynurenine 3-monooxygenase